MPAMIQMTPRGRMEAHIVAVIRKDAPNVARNVQRHAAPAAIEAAVIAASHMDPAVEAMVDQAQAHDVRQAIRDDLYVFVRFVACNRKQFGI